MNKEELSLLLENKANCPKEKLELLLAKIESWNDDLKESLYQWLLNDIIPEIACSEYSVRRLMVDKGMKVVAALMTIDWLRREPENAKKTLKRGVDRIIPASH